ncbi:hypothetical protein Goari_020704, partial [Gossypium aridum]|nr:hypothetical protein [Gossypium aridum]
FGHNSYAGFGVLHLEHVVEAKVAYQELGCLYLCQVLLELRYEHHLLDFLHFYQDWEGFLLGGCASVKGNHMSVEWVELDALIEGITMARSYNFDKIIFESDCVSLVNHFRKNHVDITILGHKIKDTRGMLEIFISTEVN